MIRMAIDAVLYFAGAILILSVVVGLVLFALWALGQGIVKTFKGTK